MAYVLTSLSGNLISAASAGYAPTNSSDVSAIASAYAESAVSSKQDASAMSAYALSSDVSGVIDTVSSNSASWGGGTTGDYVETSALEVSIGSANYIMSATSYAQQQVSGNVLIQGKSNSAFGASLAQGSLNSATYSSFSQGKANNATGFSLAQGSGNKAYAGSFAQGYGNSASGYSVAQGQHNSAYNYSVAIGYYNSATDFATAFGSLNLLGNGSTATGDSVAFVIGDGHSIYSRHDLMVVTKDGEITMYSSTADTTGTGIMSSIRALSANAGGVDSATVSAIASSYAESAASSKLDESATADFYSTSNPSGFITGVDLSDYATTAYVDSSVSGKLDTTAFNSGDFYSTSNPSGFIDSAYVDSAVSDKADSSALSSYVPYSSLEYNTASAISGINGSALAAGSTYSAGEGIDITDDVISVETPVDIVAGPGIVIDNPDGNTLRVSMAADYEVVLWETTSSGVDSGSITVSEAITNFEKYEIYGFETERGGTFVNTFAYSQIPFDYSSLITKPTDNNGQYAFSINMFCAGNISHWRQTYFGCRCHWNSTFTQMTIDSNHGAFVNKDANGTFNSINQKLRITKIVGIHRIANN